MILEQKKGPFSARSSFKAGGIDGREYVHIGIQIPKSVPIQAIFSSIMPDLRIQTVAGESEYKINKTGILEFDGSFGNIITITFLRDLPAETIIDLVYQPEGE